MTEATGRTTRVVPRSAVERTIRLQLVQELIRTRPQLTPDEIIAGATKLASYIDGKTEEKPDGG